MSQRVKQPFIGELVGETLDGKTERIAVYRYGPRAVELDRNGYRHVVHPSHVGGSSEWAVEAKIVWEHELRAVPLKFVPVELTRPPG